MIDVIKADLNNPRHGVAILDMLDAYASDLMGGGEGISAFVRDHLIDELRKRPAVHVFLAFDGDQPAGFANCIEGFSSFACKPLLNIHDFAVAPAYRGRGIARQLMQAVETCARELGCCKITLEVLEGNTVARSLYAACGFVGYELKPETGKAIFMHRPL
ncbi:N-acetyltransferase [Herbaspirillum sp. RV1423]|uniref:GNAT family N-acetyltransferase n=1 Tax=Herbaspirillum sp. RV1423 TaxID=1443993 RepID=UPI0004B657A6|nr:GNAT family N-acetyltransferase [Herbaspirillum sp. RV1423]